MTKQYSNIWWRLTPVAAILTVLTWGAWIYIKFAEPDFALGTLWLLYAGLLLPNLYLSTFALWHWKTRYRGRWAFAWAIGFVLWWSYMPGLIYFLSYILPEMRGNDPYSKSPETYTPVSPLPAKYTYLKTTCFVVGMFLVVVGLSFTTITMVIHFMIWNAFEVAVLEHVGKQFTASVSESLILGSLAGKVTVATAFISALGASLGAILLLVSQRMRWRLLEKNEIEELEKGI